MSKERSPLGFHEQLVLVTGGGRGLGAHIARAFLREGARVVVNYLSSERAARELACAAPGRALALRADVCDPGAVRAMAQAARAHFGMPVTTVVNNALPAFRFDGDARPRVEALGWERMSRQMDGILRGALNTTQAVLDGMREIGAGRIINIGTNLVQNPVVPYHDYTAAKAALLAFSRTLSHELGEYGITVNMVSGGLLRVTDASRATPDAVFDLVAAGTPLRAVTTPQEFADAVLFFASPWSRAVTGQNLVVDGGLVKN